MPCICSSPRRRGPSAPSVDSTYAAAGYPPSGGRAGFDLIRTIIAAALAAVAASGAAAQTYPTRPITLVVPFPPGGSTGIVARVLADKMSETLGQPVVIDNRGGAGGLTGGRSVAKSPPDGYTLLATSTGTMAIGPSLYPNSGFDPRKDFAPIGRIGTGFNALVLHQSVPATNVKDLIAYAKQNPGKISVGSAGGGTLSHLSAELFAGLAGIKLQHVPYRGQRPGVHRPPGRPHPDAVRADRAGACQYRERTGASARRDVGEAVEAVARPADRRRGRPAGLRGGAAIWPGRARWHAACRDRSPQHSAPRGPRHRRSARTACRGRR